MQHSASTKEIHGLTGELEKLTARQTLLEDTQLELMQRVEDDQAALASLKAKHAEAVAEVKRVHEQAQAELNAARTQLATLQAKRTTQAESVSASLLNFYDRVRARSGMGVAKLERGVCGACHLQLGPTDREQVLNAPATQLVQCPECGTILMRDSADA